MNNIFYALVGGVVAYMLSNKKVTEIEQQAQKRINELSDDVADLAIKQEEADIRSDVFSLVDIKQFVGIVGDWSGGDKLISARWFLHVVNKASVPIRFNLQTINVTIGGQSQLKMTDVNRGFGLSANGRDGCDIWLLTSYISSKKLYPVNTIKNAVSEKKETLSDNVECTIKYSLSSTSINAGVPTDAKIITLYGQKSKVYFCTAIGAGYAGTSILKNAGLIPSDAKFGDMSEYGAGGNNIKFK